MLGALRSHLRKLPLALMLSALCVACASDDKKHTEAGTRPEDELDQTETPLPDGIPEKTESFQHRGRAHVIETLIDAVSDEPWRQLDLDSGKQSDDEKTWDLSFSRFRVRINGGISGQGSVSVATLTEAFDDVQTIPDDDAFHGEDPDSTGDQGDADSEPDNAFYSSGDDWFNYNLTTHELSPREVTFVVESTAARYYKLRFLDYYDPSNGTPGVLTLRWIELKNDP